MYFPSSTQNTLSTTGRCSLHQAMKRDKSEGCLNNSSLRRHQPFSFIALFMFWVIIQHYFQGKVHSRSILACRWFHLIRFRRGKATAISFTCCFPERPELFFTLIRPYIVNTFEIHQTSLALSDVSGKGSDSFLSPKALEILHCNNHWHAW